MRVLTGTPDEGVFLYGAQRVLEGAIPARDFVEPQGPGSFYWLAAFFKLFGTSFLTARALLLATGVSTVLLVFYLARRIERPGIFSPLFVLATSIPPMVMNSPHYDSNLFALLSFAIFLYALDRITLAPERARLPLLLSGILAGFTTCFIQQKGLWLAGSFALTLFLLHGKKSARLCLVLLTGYLAIPLIELSLYRATNALPNLIHANLTWPLKVYNNINAAPYGYTVLEILWPRCLSVLRARLPIPVAYSGAFVLCAPYLFVMAVPFLLLLLGWLWRREAFTKELLPYWLSGYALWASELQRLDIGHLRNGCIILVILFFALAKRHGKVLVRHTAFGICACVVASASVNVLAAMANSVPLHSPRGTMLVSQRDQAFDFLLSHTRRGEYVFVYPYRPIYYFLADVRNPTRFSYLQYRFHTDAQMREAVAALEAKKVRYVLWDSVFSGDGMQEMFPAYRHPAREQLIVEPYLESHYREIGFANGFRILERNP